METSTTEVDRVTDVAGGKHVIAPRSSIAQAGSTCEKPPPASTTSTSARPGTGAGSDGVLYSCPQQVTSPPDSAHPNPWPTATLSAVTPGTAAGSGSVSVAR